jgi:hypothetical protein
MYARGRSFARGPRRKPLREPVRFWRREEAPDEPQGGGARLLLDAVGPSKGPASASGPPSLAATQVDDDDAAIAVAVVGAVTGWRRDIERELEVGLSFFASPSLGLFASPNLLDDEVGQHACLRVNVARTNDETVWDVGATPVLLRANIAMSIGWSRRPLVTVASPVGHLVSCPPCGVTETS